MIETGVGFPNPLFFIGAVENNVDERLEGRVQVRAFGIHGTIDQIPTADLPWATLIIGSHDVNFVVPPLNAWVFGLFLDGRSAQQPMILGLIPTQFSKINDPAESGWGVTLGDAVDVNAQGSRAQDFGQPTLSRLARGEELENTYLLAMESNRIRDISIAGGGMSSGSIGNTGVASQDEIDPLAASTRVSPGYPSDMSQAEIEEIITAEATLRGIDPSVAINIFRHEGAGSYQSQIPRSGNGSYNGKEASFGPYQLFVGSGLGNEYEQQTGRSLLADNTRDGITQQIRFALNKAATGSWEPWYGRGPAGVGPRDGLLGAFAVDNVEASIGGTTGIPATNASMNVEGGSVTAPAAFAQSVWEEPATGYNSVYPHNRVIETGSGHVIELDDTPGAERVMIFHRNGSYIQMTSSSTTIKSQGDSYSVNDKNYHTYVGGTNVITIEGDSHVLIKGNKTEEVMGNYRQIIHGNHEVGVAGQMNFNGGDQGQIRAANLILESNVENLNIKTGKNIRFESGESIHFKSNDIFIQGIAGVNVKGENVFVQPTAGFHINAETASIQTSGSFNVKAEHAVIGGGSKVSLNASTVALDTIVLLSQGSAGSPGDASEATEAQSATSVSRPSPPARSIPRTFSS